MPLSQKDFLSDLSERPRRLRRTSSVRELVAETRLHPSQLVLPVFVMEGGRQEEIRTMPGVYRWPLDQLSLAVEQALEAGINALALFPKIPEEKKNPSAEAALDPLGLAPQAIRKIKKEFPAVTIFSDIALDPFSSDGHDGLVLNGEILNDPSVKVLVKMAEIHAEAGADFLAPSDMMDGRIGAIRQALDQNGYSCVGILSYAAKYASCLYGPFRDALDSAPRLGDKKTYQMDPRNGREALREVRLDCAEGADMVMVKPAGFYLDVIHALRPKVEIPIAAYQVSGEYSMMHFGAAKGLFPLEKAMEESLLAIRRAGADLIFTYFAKEMAKICKS